LNPLTRRDFLGLAAIGFISPAEWKHYPDPATELDVFRLTDSAYASGMVPRHLRAFTRHSNILLYWSERGGSRQAYLLDLRTGESKLLTEAAALDPASLSLSPDDRNIFFFDGPSLRTAPFAGGRSREIYQAADGAVPTGFTMGSEGSLYILESQNGRYAVNALAKPLLPNARPRRILETEEQIQTMAARPRHPQLLYRTADALWLMNGDGSGKRKINTEAGQTGEAAWTPTGRTLTYLHVPEDTRQLVTLREFNPEDNSDQLIAKTSQFISAGANADASVFAGASRSKASAYVLILLRSVRRELALCEHRASDPRMVEPVFSPDSQSVFFVSDRHGKPAVYRVHVERFVEETLEDQ
jgi:oligogalacturonide lyase